MWNNWSLLQVDNFLTIQRFHLNIGYNLQTYISHADTPRLGTTNCRSFKICIKKYIFSVRRLNLWQQRRKSMAQVLRQPAVTLINRREICLMFARSICDFNTVYTIVTYRNYCNFQSTAKQGVLNSIYLYFYLNDFGFN